MSNEDKLLAQLKLLQEDHPSVTNKDVDVLFMEIAPFMRTEEDDQNSRQIQELEAGGVDNWEWYGEVDWHYVETGLREDDEPDSD